MSEHIGEKFGLKRFTTDLMLATLGVGLCYYIIAKCHGKVRRLVLGKSSLGRKKVIIANNSAECEEVIFTLNQKCIQHRVLGFDCEWLPSGKVRRPVALLQLATKDGYCALIRLCKFSDIPNNLQNLLEDPCILKVGVVPSDDAEYLKKDYGLNVNGCLDLRHLLVRNGGIPKGGLAGLAESVLGVKLDKRWCVRCSNWETKELSVEQANYAANDALVAVKIFEVLIKGHSKRPSLLRALFGNFKSSYHNISVCDQYVDVKFKNRRVNSPIVSESALCRPRFSSFKSHRRTLCTRPNPLFENCFIQAPDGVVLCTSDRKKAQWYVTKDLGVVVSEDPFTVRLKFEPAGRAVGIVGKFYTTAKNNCCVVCGSLHKCVKKNIVPLEYRKHFPSVIKDHASHDVVVLCLNCHLQSNACDTAFKKQLGNQCNAPFWTRVSSKLCENAEMRRVQKFSKALLLNGDKIPAARKREMESLILDYFQVAEMTESVLLDGYNLDPYVANKYYEPHGPKIVQYYSQESNGGLIKFERLWREHFLQTMKPKYMPKFWSLTHTEDRLAIRASENRISKEELRMVGMTNFVTMLEHPKTEIKED